MTNIETIKKDEPKNKSVLLFSGGMDSVMYYYLLNPDIILYLPLKNQYQEQEIQSIRQLMNDGDIDSEKLIIDSRLCLKDFERDDLIIPNRNLYFITIATHYGEEIYLGSVNGDRTLDKSKEFYKKCEDILDFLYQEQHWCKSRKFKIGSPFKDKTKTEILKEYLKKGHSIDVILKSYSCYLGKTKPCGVCKACFRKWVALENNDINTDDYFQNKPYLSTWLTEILPLIKKGEWRGKEDKDILKALFKKSETEEPLITKDDSNIVEY